MIEILSRIKLELVCPSDALKTKEGNLNIGIFGAISKEYEKVESFRRNFKRVGEDFWRNFKWGGKRNIFWRNFKKVRTHKNPLLLFFSAKAIRDITTNKSETNNINEKDNNNKTNNYKKDLTTTKQTTDRSVDKCTMPGLYESNRECSLEKGSGNNCRSVCCRGRYRKRTIKVLSSCNCRFKFCCEVICDEC